MATISVICPRCEADEVDRLGKARSGEQRYRYRECHHCFQLDYRYEANKPGIVGKIVEMAMNGSSVRDTSRVLGVSITTVRSFKKLTPSPASPLAFEKVVEATGLELVCEIDEQWS